MSLKILGVNPHPPSTQGTSRRLEVAEKGTAKANHRMKAPPFGSRLMCLKGRAKTAVGEDASRHVKASRELHSYRGKGKERLRRAAGSRPSAHLNFVERGNPHGVPALQDYLDCGLGQSQERHNAPGGVGGEQKR